MNTFDISTESQTSVPNNDQLDNELMKRVADLDLEIQRKVPYITQAISEEDESEIAKGKTTLSDLEYKYLDVEHAIESRLTEMVKELDSQLCSFTREPDYFWYQSDTELNSLLSGANRDLSPDQLKKAQEELDVLALKRPTFRQLQQSLLTAKEFYDKDIIDQQIYIEFYFRGKELKIG